MSARPSRISFRLSTDAAGDFGRGLDSREGPFVENLGDAAAYG